MRPRTGRIIYYGREGGFTLGEWLKHWTWLYLIDWIDVEEYQDRIDYITCEMPGALEATDWCELSEYLQLPATQEPRG